MGEAVQRCMEVTIERVSPAWDSSFPEKNRLTRIRGGGDSLKESEGAVTLVRNRRNTGQISKPRLRRFIPNRQDGIR